MNIIDAWIKAAIERKTLEIDYYSSKTKKEYTTRKVQPDYYGWDVNFRQTGLWGFCLLRGKIRCFKEESVLNWRYDG